MGTNKKWIYIGVVVAMLLSFGAGWYFAPNKLETITIEVPAESGSSPVIVNPQPLPSTGRDSIQYKDSLIFTENPFDKELAERYMKLETESEKLKQYLASIQIREYAIPFEDDKIKILNNIKAQGEVLSFKQDYTIKERFVEAEVPAPKESVVALYGGIMAGIPTKDNADVNVQLNVGVQFNNRTMYEVGIDNNKNYYAGVKIKIFDIKK